MKDPVCGKEVEDKKASATASYQGQKYAFCGSECKDKFEKNPERYAQGQSREASGSQSQGRSHNQEGLGGESHGKQGESQQGKQQEHQMKR